jgi:eukaryotic-like serine/threonine-protein kinase
MPQENVQRVGEYEILSQIGAGGMGCVYKVRNIISNREEAMKILLPDFAKDPELTARFMSEIRTLAGLEHPNIAQLRTAFQVEKQFVMVMEYVEGTTLDKLAPQLQGSLETLLDYAGQVLAALSYAHGRGVTHRDIKPANIMITSHGVVKLMDFGIAKSTTDMNLTRPGTTMGSIYYMSPEQVRGGTIDARSDIYSFGVTLYEVLTGRKPFQADTSYSVLNAQVNETPKPPAEVNPAIPQALSDIVMRAMEKDPGQRFQTAEEFRNSLKALRRAEPTPFRAETLVQPVTQPVPQPGFTPVAVPAAPVRQRPAKSHRTMWVAIGALAVVLVLVAAGLVLPRFYAMYAGQKSPATAVNTKTAVASNPTQPNSVASPASSPEGNIAANSTSGSPVTSAANANPVSVAKTGNGSIKRASAGQPQTGNSGTQVTQPASGPVQSSAPAQPSGPSPDEIRQAHNRFTDLDARAQAATAGVNQIRSQQQAQGLDMRGDILASMARMNTYMRDADRAMGQNDLATANQSMDRAGQEIEKLEKFLGR